LPNLKLEKLLWEGINLKPGMEMEWNRTGNNFIHNKAQIGSEC